MRENARVRVCASACPCMFMCEGKREIGRKSKRERKRKSLRKTAREREREKRK